jgi:hypothetical protein
MRISSLIGLFVIGLCIYGISTCSNPTPPTNSKPLVVDNRTPYEKAKDEIKRRIDIRLDGRNIRTILVADFLNLEDNVQDKPGTYFYEDFNALFSRPRHSLSYKIVERARFDLLLSENNLGAAGLLDQKTVSKLGKMLGIQAVITGKYQVLGDHLKLWVKVIDIERAEVLMIEESKVSIDNELKKILKIGSWF